jgi:hypothetical protein
MHNFFYFEAELLSPYALDIYMDTNARGQLLSVI